MGRNAAKCVQIDIHSLSLSAFTASYYVGRYRLPEHYLMSRAAVRDIEELKKVINYLFQRL